MRFVSTANQGYRRLRGEGGGDGRQGGRPRAALLQQVRTTRRAPHVQVGPAPPV